MPKELLEIKNFNVGTIMSPDMKDIPIEAASYSLNIDSVTEDGKLKGIPNDATLTTTINQAIKVISELKNPIDGSSNYILYLSTGEIKKI